MLEMHRSSVVSCFRFAGSHGLQAASRDVPIAAHSGVHHHSIACTPQLISAQTLSPEPTRATKRVLIGMQFQYFSTDSRERKCDCECEVSHCHWSSHPKFRSNLVFDERYAERDLGGNVSLWHGLRVFLVRIVS